MDLAGLVMSKGTRLLEGLKTGAELLSFRPQIVTVGALRLITTSLVAEGGYSFVYTARELTAGAEQGRMFALKKVIAQDPDTVEVGRAEMHLLQTLPTHPHVVRYFGGLEEHKGQGVVQFSMVLEYCPNGSLVDLVLPGRPPLAEGQLLSAFHSVCKAVAHLHAQSPPIAHRDLKLENVLCSANGLYKLCDFGSVTRRRVTLETRAERLREEETIQRFSTLMYRAPEMTSASLFALGTVTLTEAVDVWALGCILYTLAFRRHPFDAGTELQIVNASVRFPAASPYSEGLHDLIKAALQPKPQDRPTVFALIEQVAASRAAQLDDEVAKADQRQQPGARRARRPAPIRLSRPTNPSASPLPLRANPRCAAARAAEQRQSTMREGWREQGSPRQGARPDSPWCARGRPPPQSARGGARGAHRLSLCRAHSARASCPVLARPRPRAGIRLGMARRRSRSRRSATWPLEASPATCSAWAPRPRSPRTAAAARVQSPLRTLAGPTRLATGEMPRRRRPKRARPPPSATAHSACRLRSGPTPLARTLRSSQTRCTSPHSQRRPAGRAWARRGARTARAARALPPRRSRRGRPRCSRRPESAARAAGSCRPICSA